MRHFGLAVIGPLSFLIGGAAAPTTPPPAKDPEEIVVEGSTSAAVDRFVEAVTQTGYGKQIARWNSPICPEVQGIDATQARTIAVRIREVAKELKIPLAGESCRRNILVIVSNDADLFTRRVIEASPRLSRDQFPSTAEINRILEPRPVRLIAGSRTGGTSGANGDDIDRSYGGLVTRGFSGGSLIVRPTRENALLGLAIVDGTKLGSIDLGQLADYLAIVTLARPNMDAAYGRDTILSIFQMRDRGEVGPLALTRKDKALLTALYRSDPARDAKLQRKSIKSSVKREVVPKGDQ